MNNPLQATCGALVQKAGAELVTVTATEQQVRLTFRVPKGSGGKAWLGLMTQLLRLSRSSPWTIDISKRYVLLDGSDDDMRYSWRIIVQGENLKSFDTGIAGAFKNVRMPGVQLSEVTLHGSPNRSPTAGLAGHVPVGPLAVRR